MLGWSFPEVEAPSVFCHSRNPNISYPISSMTWGASTVLNGPLFGTPLTYVHVHVR